MNNFGVFDSGLTYRSPDINVQIQQIKMLHLDPKVSIYA